MSTLQLQRALVWAFVATLIALLGVTSVAWVRRPRGAITSSLGGLHQPAPLLANEPDGSVYDLNLKVEELQRELRDSETQTVEQRRRIEELQRQRQALAHQLKDLQAGIGELQAQVQELQRARPAAPGPETTPPAPTSGTSTPATRGPTSLPGGPVVTPAPPSPASPP